jgi:hypothetical protein
VTRSRALPRLAARLALGAAALGAACQSPSSTPAVQVKNACDRGRGSPCAGDKGACWADAPAGSNVCFARRVDINKIVVEVRPTALAPLASTTPRYARFDIVDPDTPFIDLPRIGMLIPDVDVTVRRPGGTEPWRSVVGCTRPAAVNGEVGTRATFRPLARADGIEAPAIYAEAQPSDESGASGDPNYWRLRKPLPPGELYDIYLEPLDATCPTPPLLVRGYGHCVSNRGPSPGEQACPVDVSYVDRRLGGFFAVRPDVSLEGWTVEIVDGDSGLRLSVPGVVGPTGAECADNGLCLAPFGVRAGPDDWRAIEYTDVVTDVGAAPSVPETYVRLSPPAGTAGPTFVFFFARIGPEGADVQRTFELSSQLTPGSFVRVEGTLESAEAGGAGRRGAPGAVWFRSVALDEQPSGVPTLMQGAVPTDAAGAFALTLPSGRYDILGAPSDPGVGFVRTNWSIPAHPPVQGGRVLEASAPLRRSIRVLDPSGLVGLRDAPVRLAPVLEAPREFDTVLGANPFAPRLTSAVTNDPAAGDGSAPDGTARVVVDTERENAYVLTLPFERKTGLPWTVLPAWPPGPPAPDEAIVASLPWEVTGKVVLANALADPSQPDAADPPALSGGMVRIYGRHCDQAQDPPRCATNFVLLGSGSIKGPREGANAAGANEEPEGEPGTFTILLPSSLLWREAITFRCVRTRRRRSLPIVGVRRPYLSRRPRRRGRR